MRPRAIVAVAAALLLTLLIVVVMTATRRSSPPAAPTAASTAMATSAVDGGATTATRATRDGGGAAQGRVVLSAPWGDRDGQLGRRVDPESLAQGPMSFFVDAHGVVVLDEVNRRLARFDAHGRALAPLALDGDTAQDVARTRDGVAVLDRLHDRRVTVYDADGTPRARLPLVGPGVADAAAVTGLFAADDGALYLEREHGAWMRLADAAGNADRARAPAPGRPTRAGRFVNAAIVDKQSGTVRVRLYDDAESAPAWETTVRVGAPILYLALLDGDAAGRVYLGAHTGREQPTAPYAIVDESLVLVALSATGTEQDRLVLPAPPPREEAFRDLYVGDDGTIYWMRRTAAGVVVEAYRL